MKAVIIGSGKIGRGFIGQVLYQAGYKLTFIDVSKQLIEQINRYGKYPVYTLGATEQECWVENIKGYTVDDAAAINCLAQANIITTSVGPDALKQTATYIAEAIKVRFRNNCKYPLTVIACENMDNATTELHSAVEKLLTKHQRQYSNAYVGFPDAEVSRMTLPIEKDKKQNPLAVKVEKYMEWVVDKNKLKEDLSHIENMSKVTDHIPYIKRKIYTLTGHAMLGFMGYEKGYQFIHEAAYDNEILSDVYKALLECGKAWSREYRMSEEDFNYYVTVMLRRFSDTRLNDPIRRVCHQPIRKLSRKERFISPALTAMKHNVTPEYIIKGILSVMNYGEEKDEQAGQLQRQLREEGFEGVLQTVCGLKREESLYKLLVNTHNEVAASTRSS